MKRSERTKADKKALPSFPGVTARALTGLATKLGKLDKPTDAYRVGTTLEKATGDYGQRAPLAWHLVVHGLVQPNDALIHFLSEHCEDMDEARAVRVAEVLERRTDEPDAEATDWLPGWTVALDCLVYAAYPHARAAFTGRALPEPMRVGVAFVRRRRGEVIEPELAEKVLLGLAGKAATGYGITNNCELPFVDDAGQEIAHRAADAEAIRTIALRFGSAEAWQRALIAATRENRWGLIEDVAPALEAMPLDEMVATLAARDSLRFLGDSSHKHQSILAIVEARQDPPEVLLAPLATPPEDERDAAFLRELFAVVALRRLRAAGRPIPADAARAFTQLELVRHEHVKAAALEALALLPRDPVLGLVRDRLEREPSVIAALGAHFDEAIVEALLQRESYTPPDALRWLGAPAVPALARALRAAEGDRRIHLAQGLWGAMRRAVDLGTTPPPAWDADLDLSLLDRKQRERGVNLDDLRPVFAALPAPRRDPLLLAAFDVDPGRALDLLHLAHGEDTVHEGIRRALAARVMHRQALDRLGQRAVEPLRRHITLAGGDAGVLETLERALRPADWKAVEAGLAGGGRETRGQELDRLAAAARAAAPSSPLRRIYLLDEANEHHAARRGSLSRAGGPAPGVSDADVPRDHDGEPLEHLLTLDCEDVPELRRQHPGARAVAFFCPEPSSGERIDELEIVALSAVPAARAHDPESVVLAIHALDVPEAVFAGGDRAEAVDALRTAIGNAGGHMFGDPLWIQEAEGGGPVLVQINDGLVPDLNLGDVGSLYVFDGGDIVVQCH